MAVYNGQRFLRPAIDSILNQTFQDFQLIVVDDGSTDETKEILESYNTPNVIVISQENAGQTVARNRGLAYARGKYIAIQDADDISLPDRLIKQIAFLEENLDCGLVGSWAYLISVDDEIIGATRPRTNHLAIVSILPLRNQFVHSSIMFRQKCVQRLGGYDESMRYAEDYEFVMRISSHYTIANLPEYLVKRRCNEYTGISYKKRAEEKKYAREARKKYLTSLYRSSTLTPISKAVIMLALPFTYLRYYFYHDLTNIRTFRKVKRLAYLRAAKGERKATLVSKTVILLCLPFLQARHNIDKHLKRKAVLLRTDSRRGKGRQSVGTGRKRL